MSFFEIVILIAFIGGSDGIDRLNLDVNRLGNGF